MNCGKCSTELPDDAVACYRCGTATEEVTFVRPLGSAAAQPVVGPATKQTGPVIVATVAVTIAVVLLLAVVGGAIAFVLYRNAEATKTDPNTTKPANDRPGKVEPPPVPTATQESPKERTAIVNKQFPVAAGRYETFEFTVDRPSLVSGGFRAYGGGNDIDALLVDEANYTFVVNKMDARTYYHTGYTERGKPSVRIPPGHYYFVFDNRKAWLTSKSVAAEIYIEPQ